MSYQIVFNFEEIIVLFPRDLRLVQSSRTLVLIDHLAAILDDQCTGRNVLLRNQTETTTLGLTNNKKKGKKKRGKDNSHILIFLHFDSIPSVWCLLYIVYLTSTTAVFAY